MSLVPSQDSVFSCITALTTPVIRVLHSPHMALSQTPVLDYHLLGAQPEILKWISAPAPRVCIKTGQKWTLNKYLTTPVLKHSHPKWSKKKMFCMLRDINPWVTQMPSLPKVLQWYMCIFFLHCKSLLVPLPPRFNKMNLILFLHKPFLVRA